MKKLRLEDRFKIESVHESVLSVVGFFDSNNGGWLEFENKSNWKQSFVKKKCSTIYGYDIYLLDQKS